ncbi:YdiY family protein [Erythrobacter sp. GH1-10]|uniref:YdiY family protein n=1 Tax=Erythrobacter sp. GH1-10 TaxID=3349334 RepID=UPI003877CBDF
MLKSKTFFAACAAAAALSTPVPAFAQLPEPVRAMIDAAIASGDEAKVRTVIELARETNPGDAAEIDAILASYETDLAAKAEADAAAKEEAIRTAGLFENWSGKGELGAFRSTGNSSNTGITAGLALKREGIDWRHKLTGRVDYQRSNGATTREQFQARYEPNYKISDRLFAYALAQYERDRFQGFSARYSVSGGLGYDVIVEENMSLSVKAGPAWRRTERIGGLTESNLAGLAELDFDWQIAENLALTQNASAFVQEGSSTFLSETGLQAGIADDLKVRLSYAVEHDTDPPAGAVKTDTLSRVTLIYDF